MTDRITKARAAVLATVQMYAPVHAQFAPEALRQLHKALDEHHNAVVEAVNAQKPQLPETPAADPAATSVVPLMTPEAAQAAAVGAVEEHAPAALPSVADQAAGKPVKPPKSSGKVPKPAQ